MTEKDNKLVELNTLRKKEFISLRDKLVTEYNNRKKIPLTTYSLSHFQNEVKALLTEKSGLENIELSFDQVERQKFKADMAIRSLNLLKEGGAKNYIQNHVPWIAEALKDERLEPVIASVETKGIYINILFKDEFLFSSLGTIFRLKDDFGQNDGMVDRTFVIDYSSPNIAKRLHAGHIRSTIIGHVLGNLYRSCAAKVFGINHINDFGGFGFILAGFKRWENRFEEGLSPNEKLLKLYEIRRTTERLITKQNLEECSDDEKALVKQFYGDIHSIDQLRSEYKAYVKASDLAFQNLSEGKPEETELWASMVEWSLEDFENFYNALDVDIDFVIGESFYLYAGKQLIKEALATGKAIWFTEEKAKAEVEILNNKLSNEELSEAEHQSLVDQINKDIGALVVLLADGRRFVVLRSDGLSIYATRDIGAIYMRRQLFDFTDAIYVVGQEQGDHFEKLFAAAEALGIMEKDELNLKHIYFGFYIDSITKKKLSSRDGISNVYKFLDFSQKYFKDKYKTNESLSQEEIHTIARELSIGSLVFNDLRKDMKSAVEIAGEDLTSTISEFEKSGGIYVVYAVCRARSIIRKIDAPLPDPEDIADFQLNSMEVSLILNIQQMPLIILKAAQQDNPAILARHLVNTASLYNTYYTQSRVMDNGKLHEHRFLITEAFRQSMENCLRILHVPCPKYI